MRSACLLAGLLAGSSLFGANLVKNPDLSMTDGLGGRRGTVGWWPRNAGLSSCTGESCGEGAMALTFVGADMCYFRQTPVALKSGGKYRLSAEVRTAGLGDGKACLLIHDDGWHRDVRSKPFPDNTQGAWATVEWTGKLMENPRPEAYTLAVAGTAGNANGTVRVEIRNLTLTALDAETEAASTGLPERMLKRIPARIVPIDPLLAKVSAADAKMLFYWPGVEIDEKTPCTLVGAVDGGAEVRSAFGPDGRAQLAFGRLKAGEHVMGVRVVGPGDATLATNAYRFVACRQPPKGPEGRRLNNFATELVAADLRDGEVRFFRPTDGFVWMSFDGANAEARGYLDGCAVPAVLKREGEPYLEGVRDVAAGWHVLKVCGATRGRLRIHATKIAAMSMWPVAEGPCDFTGHAYKFSFGFARRFLFPGMNVANNADRYLRNPHAEEPAYYRARGLGIFGGAGIRFSSPAWLDADLQWQVLHEESDWRRGYDISVDESAIGGVRPQHWIFGESVWRMYALRPERRVNIYWGDATEHWFDDPKVHVAELAAIANTGNGRGLSLPETYAPVLTSPEVVDKWLDLFAKEAKSVVDLVPGAKEMTLFNLSPWLDFGHWSDYPCPEGDSKALFARMVRMFATRPECAFTAGVAAGGSVAGEEELRRWIARLFRYHVFEGGTENLAEKYGYRWCPGFVKNCDFAEGLADWTAEPAEGGAIRPGKIARYGVRIQGRKKVPMGHGDAFAEFVAGEAGPNRLSQELSGLEPGRLYALMFCAAERSNVEKLDGKTPTISFHARLEGGEELRPLRFLHMAVYNKRGTNLKAALPIYRYVFRAKSDRAKLVFEDRADEGPKAPAGLRQLLNYVIFRPYYVESPEEAEEIGRLMAGR